MGFIFAFEFNLSTVDLMRLGFQRRQYANLIANVEPGPWAEGSLTIKVVGVRVARRRIAG